MVKHGYIAREVSDPWPVTDYEEYARTSEGPFFPDPPKHVAAGTYDEYGFIRYRHWQYPDYDFCFLPPEWSSPHLSRHVADHIGLTPFIPYPTTESFVVRNRETGEEREAFPSYLYDYTIDVTTTESMKHLSLRTKCSACDNATKPCLFFAYTAPNPQTGKYPRINSEGQEEDVMLYSCVSCVMANRKCSCLGRIACTDEAKTKHRLHSIGYAADDEGGKLKQPPLSSIFKLPEPWEFIFPKRKNQPLRNRVSLSIESEAFNSPQTSSPQPTIGGSSRKNTPSATTAHVNAEAGPSTITRPRKRPPSLNMGNSPTSRANGTRVQSPRNRTMEHAAEVSSPLTSPGSTASIRRMRKPRREVIVELSTSEPSLAGNANGEESGNAVAGPSRAGPDRGPNDIVDVEDEADEDGEGENGSGNGSEQDEAGRNDGDEDEAGEGDVAHIPDTPASPVPSAFPNDDEESTPAKTSHTGKRARSARESFRLALRDHVGDSETEESSPEARRRGVERARRRRAERMNREGHHEADTNAEPVHSSVPGSEAGRGPELGAAHALHMPSNGASHQDDTRGQKRIKLNRRRKRLSPTAQPQTSVTVEQMASTGQAARASEGLTVTDASSTTSTASSTRPKKALASVESTKKASRNDRQVASSSAVAATTSRSPSTSTRTTQLAEEDADMDGTWSPDAELLIGPDESFANTDSTLMLTPTPTTLRSAPNGHDQSNDVGASKGPRIATQGNSRSADLGQSPFDQLAHLYQMASKIAMPNKQTVDLPYEAMERPPSRTSDNIGKSASASGSGAILSKAAANAQESASTGSTSHPITNAPIVAQQSSDLEDVRKRIQELGNFLSAPVARSSSLGPDAMVNAQTLRIRDAKHMIQLAKAGQDTTVALVGICELLGLENAQRGEFVLDLLKEIKKLRADVTQAQADIKEATTVRDANATLHVTLTAHAEVTQRAEKAEAERDELAKQLRAAKEGLSSNESDLSTMQGRLDRAEKEIREMGGKLVEATALTHRLTTELESANRDAASQTKRITELSDENFVLNQQVQHGTMAVQEAAHLKGYLAAARKDSESYKAQLASNTAGYTMLKAELDAERGSLAKLQDITTQLESAKSANTQLTKARASSQREVDQLKAGSTGQSDEVKKANTAKLAALAELQKIKAADEAKGREIDQLKARERTRVGELGTLKASDEGKGLLIAQLQEKVERLSGELASVKSAEEAKGREIAQLKSKAKADASELARVKAAEQAKGAEIATLQARITAASSESESVRGGEAKRIELEASLAELRVELASTQRSMLELQDDVEIRKQIHEDLVTDHEYALKEVEISTNKLKETERLVGDQKTRIKEKDQRIQELMIAHRQAEQSLKDLQGPSATGDSQKLRLAQSTGNIGPSDRARASVGSGFMTPPPTSADFGFTPSSARSKPSIDGLADLAAAAAAASASAPTTTSTSVSGQVRVNGAVRSRSTAVRKEGSGRASHGSGMVRADKADKAEGSGEQAKTKRKTSEQNKAIDAVRTTMMAPVQ